jgi:hypothetical protein
MPKLLDFLKEKNISHEDAMKIIESYKPELLTEDEKEEKKEKEKTDKTESTTPPAVPPTTPPTAPAPEPPKTDKSEVDKITKDLKAEVDKITKDLKSQIALLRGNPPEGVESDQPVDKPTITKNMFEVRI